MLKTRNTSHNDVILHHYLIITESDSEHEMSLRVYLQMCNWSRKYPKSYTSTTRLFGATNEYIFYEVELTEEEVLFLKLKFAGNVYVGVDDPSAHESNRDKFQRLTGHPYNAF